MLVHPRIAAPVAEALGVASRRRLLLAASADCLSLGLAGAGGAVEAFGQSEALTTRLRHIIQVGPRVHAVVVVCLSARVDSFTYQGQLCFGEAGRL
jgi:sacsin